LRTVICDQHDPISDAAGVEPDLFSPCAWPGCPSGVPDDEWRRDELIMAGTAVLIGGVGAPESWTDHERVKVQVGRRVVWTWRWTKHRSASGLTVERG